MPITMLQPLPVGNAVRVFMSPPAWARRWRLLRNTTGLFPAYDDPDSSVIHDGVERVVLDTDALTNGTTYHYALFWFNGSAWTADGARATTPAATFDYGGPDVLEVVRDRLDLGLRVVVSRGTIQHETGHIQVLTAPPLFNEARWPLVTVHLQSNSPAERGIGEEIDPEYAGLSGDGLADVEGWLSRVQIVVVGWSLNPDERIALGKAIVGVLMANMAVFSSFGMVQINPDLTHTEDFQSYAAPVYQAMVTLSFEAPSYVTSAVAPISDITVTAR